MNCRFDIHPGRETAEKQLLAGIGPQVVVRYINDRFPMEPPVSRASMATHRRKCLGLPPMENGKHGATPAAHGSVPAQAPPPLPTGPRRSEKFGERALTDEDVEQELLKKFIDDLDRISPDKIAEYMIEREKARQRGVRAPVKGKGGEPPEEGDPMMRLKRSIGQAVGARPTRTGVRMRAVKGGRAS